MKTSRRINFILIVLLAVGGAAFQSCGHPGLPSAGSVPKVSGNGGGYEGQLPSIQTPDVYAYAGSCGNAGTSEARIRYESGVYYLEIWNCMLIQPPVIIDAADLKIGPDQIEYRGRVYVRVTTP